MTIKQTMPRETTRTRAGWHAYTTFFFMVVVVLVIYNAITQDVLPKMDAAGWRTHTAVSNVYLGGMVPGEYRFCTQAVGMPSVVTSQIDLICGGNESSSSHALTVTYHGRIDRASATVIPHWKCRRRDWTLECWAVD